MKLVDDDVDGFVISWPATQEQGEFACLCFTTYANILTHLV
jgi:hypothetical protein